MRCCSRAPLGRLFGVKTSAEMDRPVATTFMKSFLAPKARHPHQSLGQRPRVMKIKKKPLAPRLRGDSLPGHQLDQRQLNRAFSACLHDDLNSWGAAPRLDFEIAPLALQTATGFLKSL